ncbi:MAG: sigma 54-interacting transcriptional regulator, partial [Pyrinomonadaceae bacterium]|nr:sigma 54-interacting transcriptional regulator [Pyrinomonadaceae bacterium]
MAKRTEAKTDLIDVISAVTRSLNSSRDTRANLRSALEDAQIGLGLSFAFYLRLDTETDSLSPIAAVNVDAAAFRRIDARADRGPLRNALDSGTVISIPRIAAEPAFSQIFDENPEFGLIAVPSALHGENVGVLAAGSRDAAGLSSDELVKTLTAIASLIAQALRIEQAVQGERQKLREENTFLKQELKEKYDFSHIIGTSGAMKQVYEQVTQVARSNATVLLRGESGTGKELIANAIHYNSLRSKRPFVKVNCAALPDT